MIFALPILAAFFIMGLYRITTVGEPLNFVRRLLDRFGMKDDGPRLWYYPVLYCPPCMSSLWGTAVLAAFCALYGWHWAVFLPFHLLATYGAVSWLNQQFYD